MTLQHFFSKQYLFDPTPTAESRLYLLLMILFGAMILFSIFLSFQNREVKKITKRYFYAFLTCGILGYVYLFSRYETLPWLGSRFFLSLVGLTALVWITWNSVWLIRFWPKYTKVKKTEEKFEKYLPKPRKKL